MNAVTEYDLTEDDVAAAQSLVLNRLMAKRRIFGVVRGTMFLRIIALLTLAIILIAVAHVQTIYWALLLLVVVALSLRSYLLPLALRRGQRKWVQTVFEQGSNARIGRHRVCIRQDELSDSTDAGESATNWSSVERIEVDGGYVLITVKGSSPYVVPKRAFANESALSQFVEAAKAWHQSAPGHKS